MSGGKKGPGLIAHRGKCPESTGDGVGILILTKSKVVEAPTVSSGAFLLIRSLATQIALSVMLWAPACCAEVDNERRELGEGQGRQDSSGFYVITCAISSQIQSREGSCSVVEISSCYRDYRNTHGFGLSANTWACGQIRNVDCPFCSEGYHGRSDVQKSC